MILFSTLLLSIFVTIALIPIFGRFAAKLHALDLPDPRKVHEQPVPRTGGFAMAIGTFLPILLWARSGSFAHAYLVGASIIVLVGLVDDIKRLDYRVKFAGQAVAALLMILMGGIRITTLGALLPDGVVLPDWFAIPCTLLVIVFVTNAINLADGLDGLAGGICLLSLGCLGYLAYLEGDMLITLLSVALAGPILGFLRFNTYPATVFMGDTGSQLLGFSVIALGLHLTQWDTPLSPLVVLLIVGFPVLDTTTVIVDRLLHRRPLFVADKKHLHHKLLALGLFHTEAVFAIYVVQAVFVVAAIALRFYSDWLLLAVYLIFAFLLLGGVVLANHTKWRISREGLFQRVIKGRLRDVKEGLKVRRLHIRTAFGIVKLSLPLLLVVASFLPGAVPGYLAVLCAVAGGTIILGGILGNGWVKWSVVAILYLFIPFIVYLGETERVAWFVSAWPRLYNVAYVLLGLGVVLTLRWTGRREGFRVTPMDFLILFIAVAVSLLPPEYATEYRLGTVATRTVTLFFGYEVLIGELRGQLGWVNWTTAGALFVVALRGLIGA